MTHIFRLFALCLASLGLGMILDGYGVFTVAAPQALATSFAAGIPDRPGPGLRIEVVDTLTPTLALDDGLAREALPNPCLSQPAFNLALARLAPAPG